MANNSKFGGGNALSRVRFFFRRFYMGFINCTQKQSLFIQHALEACQFFKNKPIHVTAYTIEKVFCCVKLKDLTKHGEKNWSLRGKIDTKIVINRVSAILVFIYFSPLFLTSKATGWCSRHLYQWQYQLCANVIIDNNVILNRQASITMEKCTS